MSDTKSSSNSGLLAGLLTIAFVVLKLCNVIDWSWWWVLSPLWISFAIGITALIILGILYLFKDRKNRKNAMQYKSKWQQRMEEMQEAQKRRGVK